MRRRIRGRLVVVSIFVALSMAIGAAPAGALPNSVSDDTYCVSDGTVVIAYIHGTPGKYVSLRIRTQHVLTDAVLKRSVWSPSTKIPNSGKVGISRSLTMPVGSQYVVMYQISRYNSTTKTWVDERWRPAEAYLYIRNGNVVNAGRNAYCGLNRV
jgi:hypothetical protein